MIAPKTKIFKGMIDTIIINLKFGFFKLESLMFLEITNGVNWLCQWSACETLVETMLHCTEIDEHKRQE